MIKNHDSEWPCGYRRCQYNIAKMTSEGLKWTLKMKMERSRRPF